MSGFTEPLADLDGDLQVDVDTVLESVHWRSFFVLSSVRAYEFTLRGAAARVVNTARHQIAAG